MYKYLLIIMFLGSQPAYADMARDKRKDINIQYSKIMQTLSEKCETHEKKETPVTTLDQFCSDSPFNNISVRYCIYQNLLVPGNDESITLRIPDEIEGNNSFTQITLYIKCSSIDI